MVVDGRFLLLERAGGGGMGTVYRARDQQSGATVAIKVLDAGQGDDPGARRFQREAEILSRLRHPGIVSYLAEGLMPDGRPFLVMEWLEGEDLASRLARGALQPPEALSMLRPVVDALALAHRHGIVHRDLKPSNLYLRGGALDRPVVLDFGLARNASGHNAITGTGMVVGTPSYMAPEQARSTSELTPAADLFALGCILYHCLAGQPPFVGDTLALILTQVLFSEPPPLRARCVAAPDELVLLVERLLAKAPSARPRDATELAAALDRIPATSVPHHLSTTLPAGEDEVVPVHVILAVPADPAAPAAPDDLTRDLQALQALRAHGCRVEALTEGRWALSLEPGRAGAATDQAAHTARCALRVRDLLPGHRVALTTVQGRRERRLLDAALAQAVELLRVGAAPGGGEGPPPGLVAVDPTTAALLEGSFVITTAGGCAVIERARAPFDAARPVLGEPTPCVGRDQELALLELRIEASLTERSACSILVTAPAGTGKSRLCHELLRRLSTWQSAPLVIVGRGDQMSAGSPYGLIREALRSFPAGGAPRVVELIGGTEPAEASPALRAARQAPSFTAAEEIEQAFCELLAAACRQRGVLLALDDLHWADNLSVALCDAALRELSGLPLVVMASARGEVLDRFPRLWEGRERHLIELGGLRRRHCVQLVRSVLGEHVAPEVVSRIVAQAAGNVLLLEELIRAAAALRGEILAR